MKKIILILAAMLTFAARRGGSSPTANTIIPF